MSGLAPAGEPIAFHTQSGALTRDGGAATGSSSTSRRRRRWQAEAPAGPRRGAGRDAELGGAQPLRPRRDGRRRGARCARRRPTTAPCAGSRPAASCSPRRRAAGSGFDFVSRFFAPALGIDEDPVTGSAHCCLAPYWAARLGRDELVAYQASPRGGVVRVRVAGDRVLLGGQTPCGGARRAARRSG